VVAPIVGENLMPFAQLQCSRKSPRLHQLNLMKNQLPTASFRLRAYNKMGNGHDSLWLAIFVI
jgi:hypothetical protein